PGSAPFSLRLRAALERTFHQLAAGDPMTQALRPTADLVAEHHPLPPPLAASWARWRAWLDRAFPSGTSRGSPG
ncbi:MAG: hypothetical protein NZX77_19345, partial [Polyangiaceae bacterium]|nr:hypothetical protein [Polyangiaceae bacterium]